MSDPLEILARFGRALREAGLPVGTGRVVSFCRAAALVAPGDLYWAGRATLVARAADIPVYDRVFRAFFAGERVPAERPPPSMRILAPASGPPADKAPRTDGEPEGGTASALEVLKRKSFARCSPDELEQLAGVAARLSPTLPTRRTRRRRPARAGAPDLRRTLRHAFRTGGEPVERAWRERRRRRRRLVLMLDVSGSMASYSRGLAAFAHAALHADRRWEAFCFGTRLTRVTPALAAADANEALRRAAAEVVDWDGGTRIADSLKRFLDEFGHGGLARGAVIVICSDGLEIGAPELLGEQMARLARLAHRVIWLNPLKESPDYQPLARGMKAALPFVDVFASGHSLEAVVDALGRA